jgi:hypothetical protein
MSRNLVWLEDYSFAAWGCAACSWITPNVGRTLGKAPTAIRAAFEKHDCKKFPRCLSLTEKRPTRNSGLGHG